MNLEKVREITAKIEGPLWNSKEALWELIPQIKEQLLLTKSSTQSKEILSIIWSLEWLLNDENIAKSGKNIVSLKEVALRVCYLLEVILVKLDIVSKLSNAARWRLEGEMVSMSHEIERNFALKNGKVWRDTLIALIKGKLQEVIDISDEDVIKYVTLASVFQSKDGTKIDEKSQSNFLAEFWKLYKAYFLEAYPWKGFYDIHEKSPATLSIFTKILSQKIQQTVELLKVQWKSPGWVENVIIDFSIISDNNKDKLLRPFTARVYGEFFINKDRNILPFDKQSAFFQKISKYKRRVLLEKKWPPNGTNGRQGSEIAEYESLRETLDINDLIREMPSEMKSFLLDLVKRFIFKWKTDIILQWKKVVFEEQKDNFLKNMFIFLVFVTHIESDFLNKRAIWRDRMELSSAKWYYQILNGVQDGIMAIDENPDSNRTTLLTHINRFRKLGRTNYDSLLQRLSVETNFKSTTIKDSKSIHYYFSTQNLTWEEQSVFFIGQLFWRGTEDRQLSSYLNSIILSGNSFSMKRAYKEFHHTLNRAITTVWNEARLNYYIDVFGMKMVDIPMTITDFAPEYIIEIDKKTETFTKWLIASIQSQVPNENAVWLQKILMLLWESIPWINSYDHVIANFWSGTKIALENFQWKHSEIPVTEKGTLWPKTREHLEIALKAKIKEVLLWTPAGNIKAEDDIKRVLAVIWRK